MIVVGVDPGVKGSIVAIKMEGPEYLKSLDMPTIDMGTKTRRCVDARALGDWFSELAIEYDVPSMVVIEHQQAMTGDFINTVFIQGLMFGSILTAVICNDYPTHFTTPVQWKRKAGLIKKDKKASLMRARQLFGHHPDLKRVKDETRAEAGLIAFYGPPDRAVGKREAPQVAEGADLFAGV